MSTKKSGCGDGVCFEPLNPELVIVEVKEELDFEEEPAIKNELSSADEEANNTDRQDGGLTTRRFDGEECVKEEEIFVKSEFDSCTGSDNSALVDKNDGETVDVENVKPQSTTRSLQELNKLDTLKKKVSFRKSSSYYHCSACSYKCIQQAHMEYHLRTHTGEKPLACKECGYRASHPTTLKRHVASQHTGEKPYSCKLCNYRAAQPGGLSRHMRTHTGEKPYACDRCSFRAADLSSINIHKSIHTGEKPFKCLLCVYSCNRKRCLRRHMIRTHPEAPPLPFRMIQPSKTSDSIRSIGSSSSRNRNSKGQRPADAESISSDSESDDEPYRTIDIDSDTNVVDDWELPASSSSGRRIKTPKRLDL